jgi:murein DD-endopeptidase MepM/ murein hydrolase activator NlpD
MLVSGLFFIGILYIHSHLFTSPRARALREENRALEKHTALLQSRLENIQVTLTSLEQEEAALHQTMFNLPITRSNASTKSKPGSASRLTFDQRLSQLNNQADHLTKDYASRNARIQSFTNSLTSSELVLLMHLPTALPVENEVSEHLASGFGQRINPFHKGIYRHPGIDFAAPRGTPVLATASGYVADVTYSYLEAGYGNYVDIDHGNGLVTRYAHLDQVVVQQGQKVTKGMPIGSIGMSGGSAAPHLHYEVLLNGDQVNPIHYLVDGLTTGHYARLLEKSKQVNQSLD